MADSKDPVNNSSIIAPSRYPLPPPCSYLAGLNVLVGGLEAPRVLQCLTRCMEALDTPAMDLLQVGAEGLVGVAGEVNPQCVLTSYDCVLHSEKLSPAEPQKYQV